MSTTLIMGAIAGQEEILMVNIVPASISGFQANCPITSEPATAVASGGVPGYTYQWEQVSGDPMTINSPTDQTTTFSKSQDGISVGIFRVTATDQSGDFQSEQLSVSLECGAS